MLGGYSPRKHPVAVIIVVHSNVIVARVLDWWLASRKNAVSKMWRDPWAFFDYSRHEHW
jgi:hypothetical protein